MREVRRGAEKVPDKNGVPTTDHFVSLRREHHLRDGPRVSNEHLMSSGESDGYIVHVQVSNYGCIYNDSTKTNGLAES